MVMDGRRPPVDELVALYYSQIAREGITTGPGAADGSSIVDAGLIGFGLRSFYSMTLQIYTGDERRVDTADITGFNNGTGEVSVSGPMKGGGPIPAGVAYKILTQRPSISEIHGVFVVLDSAPVVVAPDTTEDLSMSISTVEGIPVAANLTAGTITITRVRAGVEAIIVAAAACAVANGRISYTYTFPAANWQDGDEYKAVFTGQAVLVGAMTYALSDQRCKGVVVDIAALAAIAGGLYTLEVSAPETVEPDTTQDLSISISTPLGIPLAAVLAPGTITITRVRAGVEVVIVAAAACVAANGRISYAYTFPTASWASGDEYKAVFTGQQITGHAISDIRCKGRVSREGGVIRIIPSNPIAVAPNTVQDISLSIGTSEGIPLAAALTAGTITITRVRAGVETIIVNAAACATANGRIYYDYTFPSASWQTGDEYKVVFTGQAVQVGATTYNLSDVRLKGGALLTPSIHIVASHPVEVEPDTYGEFDISIITVNGVAPALDLTAGVIAINRIRAGVASVIVAAGVCLKVAGAIYYGYTFPNASWQPGDLYEAVMTGQQVAVNGVTYPLSLITFWGEIGRDMQEWNIQIPSVNVPLAAIDNVLTTSPAAGVPDAENTVMDLAITAGTMYKLEDLILKVSSYGTGSQITIQLWELLGGAARANYVNTTTVVIPSHFPITTYLSLMDLFGKPIVVGAGIAITAITDVGNTGALSCTYTYSKARIY
jgi:hypothetical protein